MESNPPARPREPRRDRIALWLREVSARVRSSSGVDGLRNPSSSRLIRIVNKDGLV